MSRQDLAPRASHPANFRSRILLEPLREHLEAGSAEQVGEHVSFHDRFYPGGQSSKFAGQYFVETPPGPELAQASDTSGCPRLQGGGGEPSGDDLLEGLRKLFGNASHEGKPKKPQDGPLLQGMKSLIRKRENDPDTDLFAGMKRLIEQEVKRRNKNTDHGKDGSAPQPASSTNNPGLSSKQDASENAKYKQETSKTTTPGWGRGSAPSKQDKWQEIKWLPRVTDWSHELTDNIVMSRGPEQFAQNLEQDRGEAHVVYTETAAEFMEAVALAQAERNPMVPVILLSNIHLDDDCAQRCRVPGTFRGSIQSRSCWCRVVVSGPELANRQVIVSESLRKKAVVSDPKTRRQQPQQRSGYVICLTAPLSYQDCTWSQWDELTRNAGAFARQWATWVLPGCGNSLGDTFKFQYQDNRLSGLARVHKLEVALQLVHLSDTLDPQDRQHRWFVHGISTETQEPHAIAWVPWDPKETWQDYATRARRQQSLGLVAGKHELGLRVRPGDCRVQSRPTLWLLDHVPNG